MHDETMPARRHGGAGIASFVIAVVAAVIFFFAMAGAAYLGVTKQTTTGSNMLVGFVLFFSWFLELIALILGAVGVFDGASKKVFPVMGILLALLAFGLSLTIMAIGLAKMHGHT